MQVTAVRQVECPQCGARRSISIPSDDVELKPGRSDAAFDERRRVTCSNGHAYWIQVR
ncbi:hypothetical protein [Haloterrigena alkaliphila]|uniref:hypothetical protein n=1 Tax=Haloterrigena alkaliphila TaxID=2816475 RepID=UPI003CE4B028